MPYVLTRGERVVLVIILLIGGWLRFRQIGAVEFDTNQAYPVAQAVHTLDTGELPLVSQPDASGLFANPSLTGFFLLPMIALFRQPLAAYLLTAALNTFAIFLMYRALIRLVRRYPITGIYPALFGAALFAFNPWIIEASRSTSIHGLDPFFMALIAWALAPVLTGQTKHPRRRMIAALGGLALFAHTALLSYTMVGTVTLLLLAAWHWRPDRIHKKHIVAGIGFFVMLMIPYLVGLSREGYRVQDFVSGRPRLSAEAPGHAVRLVTGWNYAEQRGVTAPADDADLRDTLSDIAHWLWVLALISGLVQAVRALLSRATPAPPERDSAMILLIWFLLPILLLSFVARTVQPTYLLLTIPAGHALAAWGVRPALSHPRWTTAVIVLTIATGLLGSLNSIRYAQDTAAHPGAHLPDALPLEQAGDLRDALRAAGAPDLPLISPLGEQIPVALLGYDFPAIRTIDITEPVPDSGLLLLVITPPGTDSAVLPSNGSPVGDPLIWSDGTFLTLYRIAPGE